MIQKRFFNLLEARDYAGALVEWRKIDAYYKHLVGTSDPVYASNVIDPLALIYMGQGKYTEAAKLLQKELRPGEAHDLARTAADRAAKEQIVPGDATGASPVA